ncbi:hypothetical protein M885DRAFT_297004 [Pelagophyceae sp. CCMP2097]|nr:hypothetical protein M885DRAFT_297004 [Pelagophyceae sp. CCMP2097]
MRTQRQGIRPRLSGPGLRTQRKAPGAPAPEAEAPVEKPPYPSPARLPVAFVPREAVFRGPGFPTRQRYLFEAVFSSRKGQAPQRPTARGERSSKRRGVRLARHLGRLNHLQSVNVCGAHREHCEEISRHFVKRHDAVAVGVEQRKHLCHF